MRDTLKQEGSGYAATSEGWDGCTQEAAQDLNPVSI